MARKVSEKYIGVLGGEGAKREKDTIGEKCQKVEGCEKP